MLDRVVSPGSARGRCTVIWTGGHGGDFLFDVSGTQTIDSRVQSGLETPHRNVLWGRAHCVPLVLRMNH